MAVFRFVQPARAVRCRRVKKDGTGLAMSLAATIKKDMFAAMKAKNTVEKEILRVALGEITKTGEEMSEADVLALLKKLVKSNREAISASEAAEAKAQLEQEIEVLQRYLPQSLNVSQILEALKDVAEQIKAAPNQGPAMGLAMKTLKQAGASAEASDVAKAIAQIRA